MSRTTASVIRLASSKDATAIAELSRLQVENGLPWRWRPGRVQHHIRAANSTVIVAETGNTLAGFAITGFAETTAHISLLAVNPVCRRQGIASAMIQWIIHSCRTAGIGKIGLEVRAGNTGAIKCYQSLGFLKTGTSRGYYEQREDARLMTLTLIDPAMEAKRPW